jgi:hypothetical protein
MGSNHIYSIYRLFISLWAGLFWVLLVIPVQPISAETVSSDQIDGFKSPTRVVLSESGILYVTDHKNGSVTIIDTAVNTTAALNDINTPLGSDGLKVPNTIECRKYRKRKYRDRGRESKVSDIDREDKAKDRDRDREDKDRNKDRDREDRGREDREYEHREKTSAKGQTIYQKNSMSILDGACSKANAEAFSGLIAPLGVAVLEVPPADICTKNREKKEKCKEWIQVQGKTYLYVGDEGNGSVQVFINGEKKAPLGIGIGEFIMPNGIAVTQEQTVYVVDSRTNEVRVYDSSGTLQTVFGASGLDFPTDIALNETAGELYVSDYYNRRIRVYDLNGGWLRDIFAPPNDQGDPVFYRPAGLGIDPEGNLYVVDNALSCVAKINSQGDLLETIGYRDGQYWTGELSIPVDAVGFGTKIYVTSNGQRQLRVFEVVP